MQVTDPSLLRFLVDMRGEDSSNKQLRDDLMTMLIAGHETTAAVLTWALFCLVQQPEAEAKLLAEIDSVIGDRAPGMGVLGEGCGCVGGRVWVWWQGWITAHSGGGLLGAAPPCPGASNQGGPHAFTAAAGALCTDVPAVPINLGYTMQCIIRSIPGHTCSEDIIESPEICCCCLCPLPPSQTGGSEAHAPPEAACHSLHVY